MKPNILFIGLMILGFAIGLIIGMATFKAYITTYTKTCMEKFEEVKDLYEECCINGRIGLMPFNMSDIERGLFNGEINQTN